MMKIFGYAPAVIVAVFSVYYGVAIGYWSVEGFLDRLESAVAFLVVFVVWLISKLRNSNASKDLKMIHKLTTDIQNINPTISYREFVETTDKEDVIRAGKFIFRMVMVGVGTSVAYPIVAILLAVQLNEYSHLPIAWLLAPSLISIFGYTLGKYIGSFWFELDRRPRCYKLEKEEYKYEFGQERIQNYQQ